MLSAATFRKGSSERNGRQLTSGVGRIDENRQTRPGAQAEEGCRAAHHYLISNGCLLLTQSDHGIDGACSAGRHVAGNERRSKEDQTGAE